MSENVNYLFDIIVTRLETANIKIHRPHELYIEISLGNQLYKITSSRINVGEFKPDSSFEFKCYPKKLSQRLSQYGIPFLVKYRSTHIGAGTIRFSSDFLDSLLTDNFSDLQKVSAQFEHSGEVVGRLEVLCRLYSQCDEKKVIREQKNCRDTNNRINPQDVMFVLGDDQRCPRACDVCPDILDDDDGEEQLRLDTERNGYDSDPLRPLQSWPNSPTASPATCQMKSKARSEENVLRSMFRRNDLYQPYVLSSRKGGMPGTGDSPSPPDMSRLSQTTLGQETDTYYCSPAKQTNSNMPLAKPIRFCRVCLSNMSWLPTFAACPNCGAKPKLEPSKPKKPTADQILMDLLGKPTELAAGFPSRPSEKVAPDGLKQNQPSGCRCTCTSTKICAHCRIRELCADIFKVDDGVSKSPSMGKTKDGSDMMCTKYSSENLDRPHLARVFSELRELYKVKSSKPAVDARKECNQSAMKTVKSQSRTNLRKSQPLLWLPQKEKPKPEKKALHKQCVKRHGIVPRNHGWAWQDSEVHLKNGWQPGCVRKPIKRIMRFFLDYLPQKAAGIHETAQKNPKESQQPTLRVWKERSEIYIRLHSANDSPSAQMKNITFKIRKSDLATALSDIKKKLKAKGFRKCICHKSLMLCVCRTALEKRHLERALQKECQRRRMINCVNELVLTDTSESEMEFDFEVTPPLAFTPNSSVPQPRTANKETQFNKLDQNVPQRQFIKQSPYWRAYNCAAGDRYTGTAFGKPGEAVIEDGLFGKHRSPKAPASASKPKNISRKATSKGISLKTAKEDAIQDTQAVLKKNKKSSERQKVPEGRKPLDMMKYLKKHGAFSKKPPPVGPDGLTDAQRRRRDLLRVPLMPIELLRPPRRCYDPCQDQCYNSYAPPCFNNLCCNRF